MSAPAVIPRPAAQRWRDFKLAYLPLIVFAAAAILVYQLWHSNWAPFGFVGEVQSDRSTVISPVLGRMTDLCASDYQMVTNGQVLARISARSEEAIEAEFAAARADLDVMRVRMLQDQERNLLNHAQTRTELLLQKLELATARIRLRQAESEFDRARQLYEQKLLSAGVGIDQDGYEVALRDRDALRAEVAEKETIVQELEQVVGEVPSTTESSRAIHAAIEAAIKSQAESLEKLEGPSTIRSPIDGMVMRIYRRTGEIVAEGEPLFEIRGVQPTSVLGYIRQPITFVPAAGDEVKVLTRGRPRLEGTARVERVGGHLETFAQTLRVRGFDASQERGLPVLLSYPDSMELRPGELVDLVPLTRPRSN
jgi:multidrug resistance efflux pump